MERHYSRRHPYNLWVVIFQAMYSYENLPALFRNVGFRNKGIINLLLLYWYEISICSACFVVNGLICHKGWLENDRTPSVTINRPFLPLCHQSHFWIYISRTFPPKFFCRWKEEKMIDISVRKLIRISLKWWTVLRECPNLRAINLLTACRKSAKKRNGLSLKFCSMLLF